tara:strand:+ start:630 stop:953 length:324 start_codon:yes stop_codon:yes gene_type:complete
VFLYLVDIQGVKINGGESGIRTHGAFRLAGFQDQSLQPLGHLSDSGSALEKALIFMIDKAFGVCQVDSGGRGGLEHTECRGEQEVLRAITIRTNRLAIAPRWRMIFP